MFQKIIDLLEQNGHEVYRFVKRSSDIPKRRFGKVRSFFSGIFSSGSRNEIRQVLKDYQPDLVQVQNLFPLISPSVLPVIKSFRIPIVMRVSNYRLVCPNGLFLSNGKVCEMCRRGKEFWCLIRNCERSLFKSLGYAVRNWVARKMRFYIDNVTFYYAQTNFQKKCLVDEGFSGDRITVIPNMIDGKTVAGKKSLGDSILYVGRISPEKGVSTLIAAAESCSDIVFKIAGEYSRMADLVSNSPGNVEFLGHLDGEALEQVYTECRILVMPSICYEGFPGVLIEAMLLAKPVICSRIGGLTEIVEDGKTGLFFNPGDPEGLAEKLTYLYNNPELCMEMGLAGRDKVLKEYSSEQYYNRLMNVYNQAIQLNNSLGRRP